MEDVGSLPSRGAWIEIEQYAGHHRQPESLPSRGAWIEIRELCRYRRWNGGSLPSRGAWIEIPNAVNLCVDLSVAPHTGSVD